MFLKKKLLANFGRLFWLLDPQILGKQWKHFLGYGCGRLHLLAARNSHFIMHILVPQNEQMDTFFGDPK